MIASTLDPIYVLTYQLKIYKPYMYGYAWSCGNIMRLLSKSFKTDI